MRNNESDIGVQTVSKMIDGYLEDVIKYERRLKTKDVVDRLVCTQPLASFTKWTQIIPAWSSAKGVAEGRLATSTFGM